MLLTHPDDYPKGRRATPRSGSLVNRVWADCSFVSCRAMNTKKSVSGQQDATERRLTAVQAAAMTLAPLDLEDNPTLEDVETHLTSLFKIARSIEDFAKNGNPTARISDWD